MENADDSFSSPVAGFGLVAFDGEHTDIGKIIQKLGRRKSSDDLKTILLTDSRQLELYQIDGVITEHIPISTNPDEDEEFFAARKLANICRKWRIQEMIATDDRTDEILARLQSLVPASHGK